MVVVETIIIVDIKDNYINVGQYLILIIQVS